MLWLVLGLIWGGSFAALLTGYVAMTFVVEALRWKGAPKDDVP